MSASASRRMASLVTSIMSQRPMLLSAERSYSARTYGSHAGSSPSASAFSFEPTDTMQMKKPSRGYTVQSARPRALYFTFQPGAPPQRLYSMRGWAPYVSSTNTVNASHRGLSMWAAISSIDGSRSTGNSSCQATMGILQ